MASPTKEQLPKCPSDFKNELEKFDSGKMKHAQTQEKNLLPSKEVIEQEKAIDTVLQGIQSFDTAKLKHAETAEKNSLPTKEGMHQIPPRTISEFGTVLLHEWDLLHTELLGKLDKKHEKLMRGLTRLQG